MLHQLYPKPTPSQRIKLALHYLTPQHTLTRLAGWVANQQWGAVTHFIIRQFARAYKINWQEAAQPQPSDYPTFNQFFTRALKDGARPIVAGDNQIALPADGRVSQSGEIQADQLLQAKGHSFTLEDLLAGDAYLTAQFRNGSFLTTYLSPRDYHRVHMPCAATLHQMIYVPGELYSVNPFLAQHIPNLFARNERVICVFDKFSWAQPSPPASAQHGQASSTHRAAKPCARGITPPTASKPSASTKATKWARSCSAQP